MASTPAAFSLSSPLRRLSLSSHGRLSLSTTPRRLIAANSFSAGKKNGRKSAGGNNNGGKSGGDRNNNGGRSGGGGGGGSNRYPLPVPSYWPSNQPHSDNLYESFVKHHVDISHALIIVLGYMFGFLWIWHLFLYLIGFHDYMEKQKCKEVKEDSNMKVKE